MIPTFKRIGENPSGRRDIGRRRYLWYVVVPVFCVFHPRLTHTDLAAGMPSIPAYPILPNPDIRCFGRQTHFMPKLAVRIFESIRKKSVSYPGEAPTHQFLIKTTWHYISWSFSMIVRENVTDKLGGISSCGQFMRFVSLQFQSRGIIFGTLRLVASLAVATKDILRIIRINIHC